MSNCHARRRYMNAQLGDAGWNELSHWLLVNPASSLSGCIWAVLEHLEP